MKLFFTGLLIATSFLAHAGNFARFERVPKELSEITVHETVQTDDGVLWYATELGLYRYDGYTVKLISLPEVKNLSNYLRAIEITKDNRLVLGYLGSGIAIYDPGMGTFSFPTENSAKNADRIPDDVWSLLLDPDGTLWVGTYRNGLHTLDFTSSVTEKNHKEILGTGTTKASIYSLSLIGDSNVYAGTNNGLYIVSRKSKSIIAEPDSFKYRVTSSHSGVWGVVEQDGIKWILFEDFIARLEQSTIVQVLPSPQSKEAEKLFFSTLRSIHSDEDKNLIWLGGKEGVAYYNLQEKKLTLLKAKNSLDKSLFPFGTFNIFADKTGLIWLSTRKGLFTHDPRSLEFFLWPDDSEKQNSEVSAILALDDNEIIAGINNRVVRIISGKPDEASQIQLRGRGRADPVNSLFMDTNSRIWAGLAYSGFCEIDFNSQSCNYPASLDNKSFTTHEFVEYKGKLYIAAGGEGLIVFDPENDALSSFKNEIGNNATALEIYNGYLWIGSFSGLYRIDVSSLSAENNEIIAKAIEKVTLPGKQSGVWITDIVSLAKDLLIANTKGLYRYEPDTEDFINVPFSGENGPEAALAILRTAPDVFWISTISGLYEYNPATGEFLHHGINSGLPFDTFLPQASAASNSKIFFGGTKGILAIPNNIDFEKESTVPVSILGLTTFKNGKTIRIAPEASGEYILESNVSVAQVKYGVMDYRNPDLHSYRFRLASVSGDWIDTTNNQATFTNLPPGEYLFEIQGKNAEGVWSKEPASIKISVLPPWWQTSWAYTIYLIFLISAVGAAILHQNRRIASIRNVNRQLREAEELREHFIDQLEEQVSSATSDLRDSMEALQIKAVELEVANKRAQDASQLKSQFLAHISHELRTPLNGILGFADLLDRTKLDSNQKEYLQTITKSGEGLLLTVNNLLDISKIEAGKVSLETGDFSLQECVSETLVMLAPIALEKHLELCSIIDPELPLYLRGDAARLRQILTNLVGNAIKFTNSGSVTVRLLLDELQDDRARFTLAVSDTGIGITPGQREKLFTSFTQADPGIQRRFGGTGLGLSLCKMLVEAMDGDIDLQSTAGIGTTVSIRLSLPLANPDEENWQPDPRLANATILLYDSHPLSAQGFTSLFQGWKASVVETDSLAAFEAELQRHRRQARYAACVVCLDEAQISALREDDSELLHLLQTRRDLPLLVLASTLDMDRLCSLEVRFEAACIAKHAGFRTIHQALVGILNEQPQFSRTLRKLETETDSDLAGTRILIADDNAANRELLQHMLRHAGAHTAEAADGREALTRLRDEQWDLLLLDIHMPGVSGLEVVSRIRDGRAGDSMLPVIAVTANALPEMQQWARACGMDGYIIKPFTEEQLMSEIERLRKRGV